MSRWTTLVSTIGGARFVEALGGLFVALAIVQAFLVTAAGGPPAEVLIDSILIGAPGLVLVYGGYRLPSTDINADAHPRIVAWCLGGLGLLLGVVVLVELNPSVNVDGPFRARALAMGLGAAVGFAIGANEARAITRARVAERQNAELRRLQAELEETVEKLQTSNDRLEQFAYAASHDLQEPLRMVSSYLSLVERRYGDELDEEGIEFIEFAVDGADRMNAMIENLLAYSQIDSHERADEPVDCNAIVERVLTDLRGEIERNDAEITVDELPTILGNADQLEQLFRNLLGNAIKYSGPERPRIEVTVEASGDRWTFAVVDEGIGIEPEYSDRIFEIFQRLHGRAEYPGTGIGLALCERIVEYHGGEIWVESEPGSGSTFYFTLPVDRNDRRGGVADADGTRAVERNLS